jgi:hypothetical protein
MKRLIPDFLFDGALLAIILLSLPPYHRDVEAEPVRIDRLDGVGLAISKATQIRPRGVSKMQWQAALIELGRSESHYAEFVGQGFDGCRTRPGTCDPNKDGDPQSLGYWQIKRAPREPFPECKAAFKLDPKTQAGVDAQAGCASRRLTSAWYFCRGIHPAGDMAGAYSGDARGSSCAWKPAAGRAARQQRVYASLLRERAKREDVARSK